MLARPRRHRVETQGLKIHLGAIAVLAQDEEPGERGGEAGGRRRLRPMTPTPCRFPLPRAIVEHPESFAVHDATGQALAYVYFEDEKGRREVMKRLTRDEDAPGCDQHRAVAG